MNDGNRILRTSIRFGALLCGYLVLAGALIVGVDVLVRKLANISILAGAASELCGYVLAFVTSWGASLALLDRAHIRIDTLASIVPRNVAAAIDLLALVAFLATSTFLAWVSYSMVSRTAELGSRSMSPLAVSLVVPQAIWFAGLVLLAFTSAILFVRCTVLFAKGDMKGVQQIAGPRTAREEVRDQSAVISKDQEKAWPNA